MLCNQLGLQSAAFLMEVFYMCRTTRFELDQDWIQEFVDSNETTVHRIFYMKNAERLRNLFPQLTFTEVRKTARCWHGQRLYSIQKK